jgi:hypothetical protein
MEASFYSPKYLPAHGIFQDGGMRAANPAESGLWELGMIWPNITKPDLVVSCGTGYTRAAASPKMKPMRGVVADGFIPRIIRSFKSSPSLDGEQSWTQLMNRLDEASKANYFRLNSPLDMEKEPELDDVSQMPYLRETGRLHASALDNNPELVRAFWATSFVFELDERAEYLGGVYQCRGSILSRSPDTRALTDLLSRKFPNATFVSSSDVVLGRLQDSDGCATCGYYRKIVQFSVHQKHEATNILLSFNRLYSRKISGSGNSVAWMEDQQGLNWSFGRPDHQPTPFRRSCYCPESRLKKRRSSVAESTSPPKLARRESTIQ